MMQKETFPVNPAFRAYLQQYGRESPLPLLYTDLVNYSYADSLKDKKGKWTHWENAVYEPDQFNNLRGRLLATYASLKELSPVGLNIERVDFCDYGNSIPFRVKVISMETEDTDYFYVKQSDASRVYGLELEHLLTANHINFLHCENTLVEAHISGVPGDVFLQQQPVLTYEDQKALASAFVRFNESCFVRLLGDMRNYNFVLTEDGPVQTARELQVPGKYSFRAIDFDQQSYEGRKAFYFPGLFKENKPYVELVTASLSKDEIEESRRLEFTAMADRIVFHRRRLMELLNSMVNDDISENYKIQLLRTELNNHFATQRFSKCKTMGAVLKQQLKQVLQHHVREAHGK
jgi:hypothetical protein